METFKTSKIVPFLSIRQTSSWEKYFNSINWSSLRLSNGSLVIYRKTFLGTFGKLQRPVGLSKKDLLELDEVCIKHGLLFLKLEPSTDQDLVLLSEFGYVPTKIPLSPTKTVYIDLTLSENTLKKHISRSGKYGINRGSREVSNVEFIKSPSKNQLKYFYDEVQLYTSHSKSFKVSNFRDLLLRKDAFGENTFLSFVYDKNNNLCGGKFYLTFDSTVFYLYGGTTDIGMRNRAGFAQMWESFSYFKSLGFKLLDLDGVYDERFSVFTKGWAGFSKFKEKFGGTVVQYPVPFVKIYNPLVKLATKILKLEL